MRERLRSDNQVGKRRNQEEDWICPVVSVFLGVLMEQSCRLHLERHLVWSHLNNPNRFKTKRFGRSVSRLEIIHTSIQHRSFFFGDKVNDAVVWGLGGGFTAVGV